MTPLKIKKLKRILWKNETIEEAYKKFQDYEKYIKNDAILEEKSLEEIKNIMADVEKYLQ